MNIFLVKRKGESLLETIIAIAILIVGTVSMLGMVFAMLIARTAAEYETVATNLAREGIEAVRNFRDTNWINNVAFDGGFYSQSRFVASFEFRRSSSERLAFGAGGGRHGARGHAIRERRPVRRFLHAGRHRRNRALAGFAHDLFPHDLSYGYLQ